MLPTEGSLRYDVEQADGIITQGTDIDDVKQATERYFYDTIAESGDHEIILDIVAYDEEDREVDRTPWILTVYIRDQKSDYEEHFNQKNFL